MSATLWHNLTIKQSLAQAKSKPTGLSSEQARQRLARSGPNQITPHKKSSAWSLFFSQFKSPLIYILIAAALLTVYLKLALDSYVIIGVLLINALIGFFQERKAEESILALKKLLAPTARVIRPGKVVEIPSRELVVGDLVELPEGARIPADLRLLEAYSLKVNQAALTGESIPVNKNTRTATNKLPLYKQSNLVFAGTTVVAGRGVGLVVATGSRTEFGKLAATTAATESESTPLEKNLAKLSQQILYGVLVVVTVIAVWGVIQARDPLEMFLTAVAAAVSAIPEGLPAIMTIALAVGVRRMANQKAIVRRLAAIETLGSINLIATDKTGTLTENELLLKSLHMPGGKPIYFGGSGFDTSGAITQGGKKLSQAELDQIRKVLTIGALANDARLSKVDLNWQVVGDPTEGAILVAAVKAGINLNELRNNVPRIDELPFHSENRLMATTHQAGSKLTVAAKGNVRSILDRSISYSSADGKKYSLSPSKIKTILNQASEVAANGHRILALATTELKSGQKLSLKNLNRLNFLGFVAMIDAPRPSAIPALKTAIGSGIRVVMITGDITETAEAVGRQIGLLKKGSQVITGSQLDQLSLAEFHQQVEECNVFAEVDPTQKLKIVSALQEAGAVVAVTGDGANDAPILKRAQVGVAMGIGGADVAREIADVILADNNFATIIKAIEEGRTIFTNIQRVVWYLLATNLSEILIIVVSLIAALPLPLLPAQILWINVVTEGTGTIGLAIEPKHHSVLKNRPRPLNESYINRLMLERILLVGSLITVIVLLLYLAANERGQSLEYARSVAFVSLAILQIVNLFNARSFTQSIFKLPLFTNPTILVSAIASVALTIATVETQFFQNLFRTVPLERLDWLLILAGTVIIVLAVEIHKTTRKTF